jgi:hypothetical protein
LVLENMGQKRAIFFYLRTRQANFGKTEKKVFQKSVNISPISTD